ncbi:MAG: pentapeptide repeat-containing protein, partial [Nitrosotalea sp.]
NSIVSSSVNGFTISAAKIFYQNTPDIFQHAGGWMYLIPVVIVTFVLLNSIKNGIKFEIYVLTCIAATLFLSSTIKSSFIDWNCLCGQAQERYFFFAIVFTLILVIRQFDKRESSFSKMTLVAVIVVVTFNVASGFFIPSFADVNWKYVTEFYNPSGKYQCYVGEVSSGWTISIPCAEPISKNMTLMHDSSVTFVSPVQSTVTTISTKSQYAIYGQPVIFTASVFPVPDNGMGRIYIDGKPSGMPATIFDGQITFTELLPEGLHKISASYFGAPNFNASSSVEITITVLSTLDLEDKDLEGIDLQGINLSEKNLQGINLSHANLNGANLSGANLQNSNLAGASLVDANLKESELQKSNLANTNLQNANLSGSDLRDAILTGTILSDANLSNTNLKGANIVGANFEGAITNDCNGCP